MIITIIMTGTLALGRGPLFTSYLNKHIPSSKRATVLSTVSMIKRAAFAIFGLLFGILADYDIKYAVIVITLASFVFIYFSKIEEKHLID